MRCCLSGSGWDETGRQSGAMFAESERLITAAALGALCSVRRRQLRTFKIEEFPTEKSNNTNEKLCIERRRDALTSIR